MGRSRRMGLTKTISESLEHAGLASLCIIVACVLFLFSYERLFDDETNITALFLIGIANILLMATILASISKIIADAVGYSFAKKNVRVTNSGPRYFAYELLEQIPVIMIPSLIAGLLILIFAENDTHPNWYLALALITNLVTIIACATKAVSDGIVTGLYNSGALKMFSEIETPKQTFDSEQRNIVIDENGYEWYESNEISYYRLAGSDDEWKEYL